MGITDLLSSAVETIGTGILKLPASIWHPLSWVGEWLGLWGKIPFEVGMMMGTLREFDQGTISPYTARVDLLHYGSTLADRFEKMIFDSPVTGLVTGGVKNVTGGLWEIERARERFHGLIETSKSPAGALFNLNYAPLSIDVISSYLRNGLADIERAAMLPLLPSMPTLPPAHDRNKPPSR